MTSTSAAGAVPPRPEAAAPTTLPAPAVPGLTVSQLHAALDEALRSAGLGEAWVTGVVQSLRRKPRYCSFELVEYHPDAQRVKAVLPVSVFGAEAAAIAATLAGVDVELDDGLEAAFYGRLASNGAYGPLRLVATRVDPRIALGEAVVAREALVAELRATGELVAQRRLQVPALPGRIGLVAGSEGAGRADILAILGSSPIAFEILEETAAMSGPSAAADVARALARLCGRGAEVIVVARGGGALCPARACSPGHSVAPGEVLHPASQLQVLPNVSRKKIGRPLSPIAQRTQRPGRAGANRHRFSSSIAGTVGPVDTERGTAPIALPSFVRWELRAGEWTLNADMVRRRRRKHAPSPVRP